MSHAEEFQIMYVDILYSREKSVIPHSLNAGGAAWVSSKPDGMDRGGEPSTQ